MERYELANGKVYEISRWSDTCTVAHNGYRNRRSNNGEKMHGRVHNH